MIDPTMLDPWPPGVSRIPQSDWTALSIDQLARKYDSVENHGWYRNLEPTIEELISALRNGDLICDYSGGTGILADWLFRRAPTLNAGIVIADSSPKFLRLALEKHRDEGRVAFRQIQYLKAEKRLQLLDEVLPPALLARGLDGLVDRGGLTDFHLCRLRFRDSQLRLQPLRIGDPRQIRPPADPLSHFDRHLL
jgi:hypothetical protein